MTDLDADVIVIGAGAVGTSTAYHLAKAGRRVLVLEKEAGPAMHQSGRNSGVIHAGYNVKPGTAKAKFCVEGNRRLTRYCEEKGIALHPGGILVVAREPKEQEVLAELARRAKGNGVDIAMLDERGLREHEPHATGVEALLAKEAKSFDARAFVHVLTGDAIAAGAHFLYDTRVHAIDDPTLGRTTADGHAPAEGRAGDTGRVVLRTSKGPLAARAVVNAAGLFADRLAGVLAKDLRVIPFRGYYAELAPARRGLVRSHIYAAPDLNFPFLGVHLSRRADGRVIVGPGAMLAFGREAYTFWGANARDLASTLAYPGFWRMMMKREFQRLAVSEVAKSLSLKAIWKEARLLVPDLRAADLVPSYAGNRAQMVSRDGKLVEDIVVRETGRAVHVLNAVSPGLTCSLPFGEDVAGRVGA
ncbi:MAG TPA: L-2-hydroxyglutarate oxidase, partial [Candidatus Thermoplasmatota archaeon]|nr:L-2-hydroxyglutarate oxidase [Candidatus Thermoplasmatota archaeon]